MNDSEKDAALRRHMEYCQYSGVEVNKEYLKKLLEYLGKEDLRRESSIVEKHYIDNITVQSFNKGQRIEVVHMSAYQRRNPVQERERLIGFADEKGNYEWYYFEAIYPIALEIEPGVENYYASSMIRAALEHVFSLTPAELAASQA